MKIFIIFLTLSLSFISYAEESTIVYVDGSRFIAPLPPNYCDATESIVGKFMMEYMYTQLGNMPQDSDGLPEPKKVFTICGNEDSFGYPWGWIGIAEAPGVSQFELNEAVTEAAKDTRLLEKLSEDMTASFDETLRDFGMNDSIIRGLAPGETAVLWADKNIVVVTTINRGIVEGEFFEEKVIGGFSVIDDFVFYYYITDDLDSEVKTGKYMLELLRNAEILFKYNN